MPPHFIYLTLAIAAEVIGTSAMQASQQFTRLGPSLMVVVFYAVAFYFLSLTLKVMPVGVVYAVWSGLGIVLIALVGFVIFGQRLDAAALIGMGLIVAGVMVINLFSSSAGH